MIRPTSQNSLPSKGKPLTNKIQKTETVVENVPEGYVTGEVFRNNVKSKVFKHYKENGYYSLAAEEQLSNIFIGLTK